MSLSRSLVLSVVGIVATVPLAAQECACPPKPPEPKKPPYEFVADFSLASSQGNQEVLTTALGQRYSYAWPSWKLSQYANLVYGRANGVTNAQLYTFGVRGDRKLTSNIALFVRFDALRNEPAGLRSVLSEAAGLSWTALKTDRTELRLDAGLGALQRRLVGADSTTNDFVGNLDGFFRQNFTKDAYFEQTVNFVPNFTTSDAWLLTARSSVVAPISRQLGLKLGYLITFNNAPAFRPAPNQAERFRKFDGLFTAGLQFTY
ncbi:MAG: DUF481 domain-containing protein [Gemmatimonadaceae bacterium]|jgi:putative salt-induced outer membrane protein|nr:DUF481 domain-containing protein [Gemmatimonadaceae bacterium]